MCHLLEPPMRHVTMPASFPLGPAPNPHHLNGTACSAAEHRFLWDAQEGRSWSSQLAHSANGSRPSLLGRADQVAQPPPSGVFSLLVLTVLDDRVGDCHDLLHDRADNISIA
jgi:hypothetical protein